MYHSNPSQTLGIHHCCVWQYPFRVILSHRFHGSTSLFEVYLLLSCALLHACCLPAAGPGLRCQGAVAGDVDGDGLLEIVFGTADGKLHVMRGTDGRPLPGFPFQTGGRIQAPATITNLQQHSPHQHIMVMSFDGYLYLIDGKSACAHTVDIGEASYASVLVDDLCGDGLLELLVATMNGNVYMLQTQQPYHPAKTWSSQVQGINGLVSRWGYFGFVATQEGRQLRDVAGQHLQVSA